MRNHVGPCFTKCAAWSLTLDLYIDSIPLFASCSDIQSTSHYVDPGLVGPVWCLGTVARV